MTNVKHCELCDNRIFDLNQGITCRLTHEKPNFSNKCPDILFERNYLARIKEVNIEFHKVATKRAGIVANSVAYCLIGLAIMAGGYLLGSFALEAGVISTVPLIIIGVGFLLIPRAIGLFVGYKQELDVEKNKKKQLDQLLANYNFQYTSEILIDEDRHGNRDYDADITFSRVHFR